MRRAIGPGSEVDAWCTKCKLDLNHRIIAMEGERIARVECLTCRGHHQYRQPKSASETSVVRRDRPGSSRAPRSASAPRAPRLNAADKLRQSWEQAIMGRSPADFSAYSISLALHPGQLVRHKKFGDGVVTELLEGGKASVLFELGTKTLVHGGG